MGWGRIDDGFHDHPKVIGASLEAVGLWLKCFTWAHRHQGSSIVLGHIPEDVPQTFAGQRTEALVAELVRRRLWDLEEHLGGWVIHDYVDYLPASERPDTASEVSKARSDAGKRGAEARWSKTQRQGDSNLLKTGHADSMPPTRPIPDQTQQHTSPTEDGGAGGNTEDADTAEAQAPKPPRNRGSRLPEPFIVTADMRRWAAIEVPAVDVDASTRMFVDHWRAATGRTATKADWHATWRNWLRRDAEHATPAPAGRRESSLDRRDRQVEQMFRDLSTTSPLAIGAAE